MTRSVLLSLLIAAIVPAPAAAGTVATVPAPTPMSAYRGVVAWSSLDPATGRYALTVASGGIVSRVPVRTRRTPFDVDLGPDASGALSAVYSRCRKDPGRQELGNALIAHPDWSTGRGCRLYRYSFARGRETRLRRSGTASEFAPSIWKGRLAFASVRPGGHPRVWLRRLDSRAPARPLAPGAPSRYVICIGGDCHRKRLITESGPTGIDLRGDRLAMTWDSGALDAATSSAYVETIRPHSVDRRRLYAVSSGDLEGQEVISPSLDPGGVAWGVSRYGEDISATLMHRALPIGPLRRAVVPPLSDQEAYLRPVLAFGIDGDTVTYLASGAPATPEPGCTPGGHCTTPPGCTPQQPCVLQQVSGLLARRR